MRQVVLDTETTGLEFSAGHRIIEIGCVEIVNRRPTGQKFHRYVNPEREIDAGAMAVHGITNEKLATAPKFGEIAEELLAFIGDAELVIHNAPFDVGFLDAEFARLPGTPRTVASLCKVLDTLALARKLHPGQRNGLDALCKRYSVDNSKRELHGALLDAGILVDVYLAMTGGQSALALDVASNRRESTSTGLAAALRAPGVLLAVPVADDEEMRRHEAMLDLLHKSSGGKTLWRQSSLPDGDGTHRNH
jgi:DNA polymerase III subunit epsilon